MNKFELTTLEKTVMYEVLEDYVNADNFPENVKIAYVILNKLEKDLYTTQDSA